MSTQPQSTDDRAGLLAGAATPDALARTQFEERADMEEDRRRQRELEDAEMGGES